MVLPDVNGIPMAVDQAVTFAVVAGWLGAAAAVGYPALGLLVAPLARGLNACDPQHRRLDPAVVWRLWVPVYGSVWGLFAVPRVADALRKEYDARRLQPGGQFGSAAVWVCLLAVGTPVMTVFAGGAVMLVDVVDVQLTTTVLGGAVLLVGMASVAQLVLAVVARGQIDAAAAELATC